MDSFDEIRHLRDEYEASLDEVEKRRAAYHRAIQKLHLSGMPLREIAEGLGVSHQRVHQIVTGETAAPKRRGRVTKGIAAASILALTLGGGYLIGREESPPIAAPASPRPSAPAESLSLVGHCVGGHLAVAELSPRTGRISSLMLMPTNRNTVWVQLLNTPGRAVLVECRVRGGPSELRDLLLDPLVIAVAGPPTPMPVPPSLGDAVPMPIPSRLVDTAP